MANRVKIVSFKTFLHHYTILCLDHYLFEPLMTWYSQTFANIMDPSPVSIDFVMVPVTNTEDQVHFWSTFLE